ncbi:hypothetical protein OAT18_02405 [Tenacibaculum sp.]|nr:hypothetical protein [Tenacibaculum sp.]
MKKSILNLGKTLNRAEQKEITGSRREYLYYHYQACKCDVNGRKINLPCDGGCAKQEPNIGNGICEVYPDMC